MIRATIPYTREWFAFWRFAATIAHSVSMALTGGALFACIMTATERWPAWTWAAFMAAAFVVRAGYTAIRDYMDHEMSLTIAWVRAEMERRGMTPPPLPPELAHLDRD